MSEGVSGPKLDGGGRFTVNCTVPVDPATVEWVCPANCTTAIPFGKWSKGRQNNIDRLMMEHFKTAGATTPVTRQSQENLEAVN